MEPRRTKGRLLALAVVPWLGVVPAATTAHAGATMCTAADAPGQGPGSVDKVINTDAGCDNGNGEATVPISGYISVQFPVNETNAVGSDAFSQPPGASGPMLTGTYAILFDRCSGGAAIGGSYAVSGGAFPQAPVTDPSNPLSFTASVRGGLLTCAYTITGPSITGSRSFTNDIFVIFTASGQTTHAATNSVHPPQAPAVIPEAPLAAALPVAALGLFGTWCWCGLGRKRGRARAGHEYEHATPDHR